MKTPAITRVLSAGCALLCAFSLAACGARGGRNRGGLQGEAPPIPTTTSRVSTIHPTLTISGIVAPYLNVQLSNALSEPTATVNVNEGDRVYRGEVIATLDVSDLQAQYESDLHTARSDEEKASQTVYTAQQTITQGPDTVANAREALAQAQSNLQQAQLDLARDQALEQQGYIPLQTLQTQRTLTSVYQSNVRSDQASLDSAVVAVKTNGTMQQGLQASTIASAREDAASARAQARQLAAEISRGTIVSPIDGVVVNRNLNPGEYPGSRTIFVLQQVDPVYAELNASSADVFRVHQGAPVAVSVVGDGAASYNGRVVGVLGQVQPGSTNFTVKVIVYGTRGKLAAGLPVTGKIDLPSATGVAVPTAAFLDDSHTSIMTDQNDTATLVHVREVSGDGTTSIVTGLKPGVTVISNGQLGITAGEDLGGP
ncbi:MAG TPA: HlyD family efflux transporter periplasmic adaptor subunit [Candidatus Acidoferrales bacterium]|nr:HlyD family efflux transporter periplasmic adaptor subunit [Candidatus Acidoferrales bacterium]